MTEQWFSIAKAVDRAIGCHLLIPGGQLDDLSGTCAW